MLTKSLLLPWTLFLGAFASVFANEAAMPAGSFPFSRSAQQTADGFYDQPAGLCEDYPEETRSIEKVKRDLEIARAVGARVLRVGIGWDGVESEPGKFDWAFWDEFVHLAPEYGVTLIPYLCYTPEWAAAKEEQAFRHPPRDPKTFARFAGKISERYGKAIGSWELWNEPDNAEYWTGSAKEFSMMATDAAAEIRKTAPLASRVLGGLSAQPARFLETLIARGTLASFEAVNIHGYLETWNPDTAEDYPDLINRFADRLKRDHRRSPDLWLAEFGYSSARMSGGKVSAWAHVVYDYEHTPEFQAVALLRHHLLALSTGRLSLTAWYRIRDLAPTEGVIGDANNRAFGIADVDGKEKPAFAALKLYNQLLGKPVRCITPKVTITRTADSQSVTHVFEIQNGGYVVAAWLRTSRPGEIKDQSGSAKDQRRETITIAHPDFANHRLTVYNSHGERIENSARLEASILGPVDLSGGEIFIARIE